MHHRLSHVESASPAANSARRFPHPSAPSTRRVSERPAPAPQFACYNAVLRRFPADLYERMGSFTTTIFVLVSAVQKVARVMRLPEGVQLYRGMGGLMDLPPQFSRADAQGVKGFVEWGFMSTTSDLKVGPAPVCFGACGAGDVRRGPRATGVEQAHGVSPRPSLSLPLPSYPSLPPPPSRTPCGRGEGPLCGDEPP